MSFKVPSLTQTDYAKTGKLYRKIDIFVKQRGKGFVYHASTNQWKTLRDAKASFLMSYAFLDDKQVKVSYR